MVETGPAPIESGALARVVPDERHDQLVQPVVRVTTPVFRAKLSKLAQR